MYLNSDITAFSAFPYIVPFSLFYTPTALING